MPGARTSVKSPLLAVALTSALAGTVLVWRLLQRRLRTNEGDDEDQDLFLSVNDSKEGSSADDNEQCIYLDYNGTTPIYPEVLEAMMPYLTRHFGNPSSGHSYGDAPAAAIATARKQILRELLGVTLRDDDDENSWTSAIVFTSCGTEADNLVIHWALQMQQQQQQSSASSVPHVVTSNVEHPAIEECLKAYVAEGRAQVTFVPVGTDGRVAYKDVVAAIQSNTVLVTLMLANNETGALQPVREIAEYCRRQDILFHTDAAQAAGKVSCRLQDLGHPDMITLVGHKIGAPKGISCLYVRPGCLTAGVAATSPRGLLLGGGQEQGRRAGTENVPYMVGMGVAAVHCARHLITNQHHMERLRQRLETRLRDGLQPHGVVVRVNGPTDPAHRLPNTLSIGFGVVDTTTTSSSDGGGGPPQPLHSGRILAAIRTQVAASAGATCHSALGPVSSILRAMQVPDEYARATVRLSVGPKTTVDQVDRAADILINQILKQRQQRAEA